MREKNEQGKRFWGESTGGVLLVVFFVLLIMWLPTAVLAGDNSKVVLGEKQIVHHQMHLTSGPTVSSDEAGGLHLAWIQQDTQKLNVYYSFSTGETLSWSPTRRVNPESHKVTSLHAPPAMAVDHRGDAYVAWPSPHPQAKGKLFTNLLQLSRVAQGSQTKEGQEPVQVNDDSVATGHSFDNVMVDSRGLVHVSWLDAREGKKDPAVFMAHSKDQARTMTINRKVDEEACVCCRTAMASATDGTLYVVWRKVYPGNIRETVIARSTDGGTTFTSPVIVGNDRWAFNGCPHRPASIGVDNQGRVYVAWYTEGPNEVPGVYVATSDDKGQTFTSRKKLNTSKGTFPDHPQLAVDGMGRVLMVWEEQSPVRLEVVMRYSSDRGETFGPIRKLNQRKSKAPSVSLNSKGQGLVAWLEQVNFPAWSTITHQVSIQETAMSASK